MSRVHRTFGTETEFSVGFLLQRARGKRGTRSLREWFYLDFGDPEVSRFQSGGQIVGLGFIELKKLRVFQLSVGSIEVFARRDFSSVHACQRGEHGFLAGRVEGGFEIPVGCIVESNPLPFTLHD